MPGSAMIPKDVKVFRFHDPSDSCHHRKTSEVTLPRGLWKPVWERAVLVCSHWWKKAVPVPDSHWTPCRGTTGNPSWGWCRVSADGGNGSCTACVFMPCLCLRVVLLDKDAVKDVSWFQTQRRQKHEKRRYCPLDFQKNTHKTSLFDLHHSEG